MELNKRKSLLTPAVPTVWGMIHGDISKQQDIVDMISEKLDDIASEELLNKVRDEILAEINPVLNSLLAQKQPTLESGKNIKTLSGRSILGEGDLDALSPDDRWTLEDHDSKITEALMSSSTATNVAYSAELKVKQLKEQVDEQIGAIDTITEDILG